MSKLYPCKASITQTEYVQIVGLLAIAKRHMRTIEDIEKALREIIGQTGDNGHCGDAIFCNYTADELLEKMEVKVQKPKRAKR